MHSLTRVELVFVPHRINIWLCFGHADQDRVLDPIRRALYFAPQSVFGLVHWQTNTFGTTTQQLYVLHATLPDHRPVPSERASLGAECLLRVAGERKVNQVLALIDVIEDQDIDPAQVSPNYWRQIHSRFAVGLEPSLYTRAAHVAYRERLALGR